MLKQKVIMFLSIMLVVCSTRMWAGTFLLHTGAGPQMQVWYNCSFNATGTDAKIMLRLSTTGYILPYINGRIATRASIWPSRIGNAQGIATEEIDVTSLVKKGKNIIALWYSPVAGLQEEPDGQVSVDLYSLNGRRKKSLCNNDSKWMVHTPMAYTWNYGEDFDATGPYNDSWRTKVMSGIEWLPAAKGDVMEDFSNIIADTELRACNTVTATCQEKNDSVYTYVFPKTVTGQLRATIRGTKKGQTVCFDDMKYICKGISDEQFLTRFSTITTDRIVVTTETGMKMPKSIRIEIIELKEKER